jgi:hypothetical protein
MAFAGVWKHALTRQQTTSSNVYSMATGYSMAKSDAELEEAVSKVKRTAITANTFAKPLAKRYSNPEFVIDDWRRCAQCPLHGVCDGT